MTSHLDQRIRDLEAQIKRLEAGGTALTPAMRRELLLMTPLGQQVLREEAAERGEPPAGGAER